MEPPDAKANRKILASVSLVFIFRTPSQDGRFNWQIYPETGFDYKFTDAK